MKASIEKAAWTVAAATAAASLVAALAAPLAAADGKEVFLAQKCNMCHAVSSAGVEATAKSDKMKGPDLTGVVAEKGADWTKKWISQQVADKDGKKHKKEYKGTPAELDQIVAWLETQKK